MWQADGESLGNFAHRTLHLVKQRIQAIGYKVRFLEKLVKEAIQMELPDKLRGHVRTLDENASFEAILARIDEEEDNYQVSKEDRYNGSSYVGDNHRPWDERLSQIGFVLRTAVHAQANQYSTTFLNFGRALRVSGKDYRLDEDGLTDSQGALDNQCRQAAEKMETLSPLGTEVEDRLRMAYEKNKSTYNLRRRQIPFAKGDMVWRKLRPSPMPHPTNLQNCLRDIKNTG
ncbi:hypothetical protein AAG570_006207 [Ranatra chinensis]|uniref:Uncharacterized protein n=1 Tax=Ranatra chinensis TaxID=642074 RepID=A0ABD0YTZ0_9HEMI